MSALQVSLSEKDLKLEKSDKSYKSLQESYEGLKDEQEDLLIMLTDQEEKVKKYKKICKDLGHQGEMSDSSSSDNEDVGNDEWSYVPDNGMICSQLLKITTKEKFMLQLAFIVFMDFQKVCTLLVSFWPFWSLFFVFVAIQSFI